MKNDLDKKRIKLIKNAEKYHDKFYKANIFTGPSFYFHKKALNLMDKKNDERYLEAIYAVLVSWGMHKMGPKGAKMVDFEIFKDSYIKIESDVKKLRKKSIAQINKTDMEVIKKIFFNIKIMESKIIIVGNSKVMAHLLPNLIPPIDRQYTLNYIKNSKYINSDIDNQWALFEDLLNNFFQPLCLDEKIEKLLNEWLDEEKFIWDTSKPKIIDNLIIGALKN